MFQISTMANFLRDVYKILTSPDDKHDEEISNRPFALRGHVT